MKAGARIVLLAVLLTTAAAPPVADAGDDLAAIPKLTTKADERLIADWWRDPALPVGEAERRTFELVLRRRLGLLPESTARAVLLDRTLGVYFSVARESKDASYVPLLRRVRIQLPADLRNSSSYYFALMHELEHSVQLHSDGLWKTAVRQWLDWRGLRVWLAEKEAMEAEWHYLRSIPESDRLRIADELAAGPYAKLMNLEIHNHRVAGGTLEDYLRDQWSVGRYSRESLTRREAEFRESGRWNCHRLVAVAGTVTAYFAANRYCGILRAKRADPRNRVESPTFYRYYCEGVRKLD